MGRQRQWNPLRWGSQHKCQKFNSIANTKQIPECLTALLLLSNSHVDDSQRVSILAAASPSSDELPDDPTNNDFLVAVTHEWISWVIRQCEKQTSEQNLKINYSSTVGRNPKYIINFNNRSNYGRSDPTMQKPCLKWNKYGRWSNQHLLDGSLPPGTKPYSKAGYSNGCFRRKNQHNSRNQAGPSENPKMWPSTTLVW